MMKIQMFLELVKYDNISPDESTTLIKECESNFIPRMNERVLDEAIPGGYLLVKQVTWDIQGNNCRLDLVAPGVSKRNDLEESAIPFIENGWAVIK